MEDKYEQKIQEAAEEVFNSISKSVTPEDLERVKSAFEFAKEAHSSQKRKSGEPYILHPIAVATIVAREMKLDANTVIAAFLHDVVEDSD